MYTKLCVLLLAFSLSNAAPGALFPDMGLMQFMNSRDLKASDPTVTLGCFDYYLPALDEIAQEYKVEYAKCLDIAQAARDSIDDTTQGDRSLIDAAATEACAALNKCSQNTGSIDYFECYTNIGAENTKTMYTISANSSELLAVVREDYRLIDNNQYVCTNKSERVYIENSAATYDEFNNCLLGLSPVPTTTASTAAPTGDSSTEPTSTESSTGAPSDDTTSIDTSTESSTSAPVDTSTESSTSAPIDTSTESSTSSSIDTSTESSTSAPIDTSTESSTSAPIETSTESSTSAPIEDSTTTAESSTAEDSTPALKEMPEEDVSLQIEEEEKIKTVLDNLKKWFKRH